METTVTPLLKRAYGNESYLCFEQKCALLGMCTLLPISKVTFWSEIELILTIFQKK